MVGLTRALLAHADAVSVSPARPRGLDKAHVLP